MTTRPPIRIGVLAVQGGYDLHAAALRDVGAEPVLVKKPEQLKDIAGLIIPGGESTTFLKFLERDGFLEDLSSFTSQKPTFGTCAGCILLATEVTQPSQESLARLNVTVERNAYGRQNDSAIEEGPTTFAGGPLEMVYIRAPRITRTGAGVEVLAEREGSPTLVREGNILAATFHPELSSDRRVHQYFLDMVRDSVTTQS